MDQVNYFGSLRGGCAQIMMRSLRVSRGYFCTVSELTPLKTNNPSYSVAPSVGEKKIDSITYRPAITHTHSHSMEKLYITCSGSYI